jgi:hypothetical protein
MSLLAQEVHVRESKDNVSLSITAKRSYQLMAGRANLPILTVGCAQRGKKAGHIVLFQPGTPLAEESDNSGLQTMSVTVDNHPPVEAGWIPYGDTVTFAYYGKTEPERLAFIHLLQNSTTLGIEFQPFLTGMSVTSHFSLDKLRDEITKRSECVPK